MKTTWFFGLLCSALTLLLVGYTIHMQKEMVVQKANSDNANLVNLVEMDLTRTFASLDQIFMGLENHLTPSPAGRKVDPPEIRRTIDYLVQQNNYLSALMVLDAQGQVRYWNNNFQKPNLKSKPYFQVHQRILLDGLFFGAPQPSIINDGQWVAGISKAIRRNGNALDMVMVATLDLGYFERQYQSLLGPPGTTLAIASTEGQVYVHIPPAENGTAPHDRTTPAAPSASRGTEGTFSLTKRIGDYPLLVTITKEKSAVLGPWKESAVLYLALGLSVTLLLLFMTWRTALYQRRQLRAREEMYERSGTDPLTEATSQPRVLELAGLEIKKSVRTKSPLSVILLDLDHFKMINKTYGRPFGDRVLQRTAEAIKECDRATDILARYDGVNFLLLLPDTDLRGAVVLARKIHERLEHQTYQSPAGEFQVTASFGVSQWAPGEEDIEPAIKRAAAALYEVKNSGRNSIRWMPSGLGHEQIGESVIWLHNKDRNA